MLNNLNIKIFWPKNKKWIIETIYGNSLKKMDKYSANESNIYQTKYEKCLFDSQCVKTHPIVYVIYCT